MDIIGIRAVRESLNNNDEINRLIVEDLKSPKLKEIIELAVSLNISIKEDRNYFRKFSKSAQGVAVQVKDYEYYELDEFLKRPMEDRSAICALDSIQDVGNLGSIIRSASIFNISAIIITKDRSASITPAVIKTSQGGLRDVPIIMVVNLARALRELKEAGYFICGTDMAGDPIDEIITGGAVYVIGSEHSGLRPGIRKECDKILTIPMNEKSSVGCLNAAVAASIVFYEYFKRV